MQFKSTRGDRITDHDFRVAPAEVPNCFPERNVNSLWSEYSSQFETSMSSPRRVCAGTSHGGRLTRASYRKGGEIERNESGRRFAKRILRQRGRSEEAMGENSADELR